MFLKAGDTAFFFDPTCVKALLDAQMDPEWFGSYEHTAGQIAKAQARCQAWDDTPPAQRRGMTPPTAADRYLAASNSGHIMQNAVAQNAGARRGNFCDNAIEGYDSFEAPSMPMEGAQDQLNTEEGQWNAWENIDRNQAGQEGRRGSGAGYDPDIRRQQQRERIENHVETHQQRMGEFEQQAQATGGKPGAQRASAAEARDANKNPPPKDQQVKGDDAAECIQNWSEKQEEAMYDRCANNAEANQRMANDPARRAARQQQLDDERNALANSLRANETAIADAQRRGRPLGPHYEEQANLRNNMRRNTRDRAAHASVDCAARQGARVARNRANREGRIF